MSFATYETSVEFGAPVELYEVTIGVEQPYRFTSSEDQVTVAGFDYGPVASVKREKEESGPAKRANEFRFEMPAGHAFPRRYAGTIPGSRVRIIVSRYHRGDGGSPEVRRIFAGFVESIAISRGGHLATVISRSELAAMSHTIPREGYQAQCNNLLYGTRCTVDRTDAAFRAHNASVSSVDGRTLLVAAAASFPDGWFNGGRAEVALIDDHRMIVSHVGSTIELHVPFATEPDLVTLYAGCAHTREVCHEKFDNQINFRGFDRVPKRNPFTDGLT